MSSSEEDRVDGHLRCLELLPCMQGVADQPLTDTEYVQLFLYPDRMVHSYHSLHHKLKLCF